jgi:hypothetical protein
VGELRKEEKGNCTGSYSFLLFILIIYLFYRLLLDYSYKNIKRINIGNPVISKIYIIIINNIRKERRFQLSCSIRIPFIIIFIFIVATGK